MKKVIALISLISVVVNPAFAEESEYERDYGWLMEDNLNAQEVLSRIDGDLQQFPGAVYGHRNFHEMVFATVRFPESKNPLPFEEDIRPISPKLMKHLDDTYTDAFLVIKDGVVVQEYYAKGMSKSKEHPTYSSNKSWTTMAWSPYFDKVNLEATIETYLPALKGTPYGAVTMQQNMDMLTKIDWDSNYQWDESGVPVGETTISGHVSGWYPPMKELPITWVEFLKARTGDASQHGKQFQYVDGNLPAFSIAMEQATGVDDLIVWQEMIDKLGFEYRSGCIVSGSGELSTDGGMAVTARDWAKMGQVFLNNGKMNGKQVVPAAYFEDIRGHNGQEVLKGTMYEKGDLKLQGYRNYWYKKNNDVYYAFGSYGQYVYVSIPNNVVVVKFSTYPDGQDMTRGMMDLVFLPKYASKLE
jgi:hypothetical protein